MKGPSEGSGSENTPRGRALAVALLAVLAGCGTTKPNVRDVDPCPPAPLVDYDEGKPLQISISDDIKGLVDECTTMVDEGPLNRLNVPIDGVVVAKDKFGGECRLVMDSGSGNPQWRVENKSPAKGPEVATLEFADDSIRVTRRRGSATRRGTLSGDCLAASSFSQGDGKSGPVGRAESVRDCSRMGAFARSVRMSALQTQGLSKSKGRGFFDFKK